MNNLSIFRKAVHTFLERGEILNSDHWAQLINNLCDLKLLSPSQMKMLNSTKGNRQYPISIPQFEQIIMKQFSDEPTKALLNDIKEVQKQIREVKGILNVWNEHGLTKKQINALDIKFAKGNQKMEQICVTLNTKKKILQSICEQQIQMIKAMDEWVVMQKVEKLFKDYMEFQKINKKAIDELFHASKVRDVHFRTKKATQKNVNQSKIYRVMGFNSKNDQPIDVYKIPKKSLDFESVDKQLVTFNALKDLYLSPYYLRFYGYNIQSDPNYFLYFREYCETTNLANLLEQKSMKLQESMPIFKYWATEIYKGMRDLYMQSSYFPSRQITLKDIEIAEHGLKVIFKHVQFSGRRSECEDIEPKLMKNLANLILSLLSTSQLALNDKIKNNQNRSLLNALLNAEQGYKRYKDNIVRVYINFHNIQTHPLFESQQELHGLEVLDNYTLLFK